jgi:hypothetical protein
LVLPFLSTSSLIGLILAGSRELSKREECRLFLFLSFAYRLFLFSVLLFLDWRHPMGGLAGGLARAFAGGLAQAFAAQSGSSFRRRSGSSFSPRGLAHAFAGGLAQALTACFLPFCLSPVACRALSSSALPVLRL